MKKYIFLDVDGVIVPDNNMGELSHICQERLGKILERTNANIILSSSRRTHILRTTIEYMENMGFKYSDKIVGITIRGYHYVESNINLEIPRGIEIKHWIENNIHSNNGKNYEEKTLNEDYNYIILDDDTDMLLEQKDNFVHIDREIGIQEKDVIKSVNILNYETNN